MSASDALIDVPVLDVGPGGQTMSSFRSFGSASAKLAFLYGLAVPTTTVLRAVESIAAGVQDGNARLRALHDWRASNVVYRAEPEEFLETARHVLAHRLGDLIGCGPDCEDHFVLGCAMVRALGSGYMARAIALGGTPDDPMHCSMLVSYEPTVIEPAWWAPFEYEPPPGWIWSETSEYPAAFGESPLAAFNRKRA